MESQRAIRDSEDELVIVTQLFSPLESFFCKDHNPLSASSSLCRLGDPSALDAPALQLTVGRAAQCIFRLCQTVGEGRGWGAVFLQTKDNLKSNKERSVVLGEKKKKTSSQEMLDT